MIDCTVLQNNDGEIEIEIVHKSDYRYRYDVFTLHNYQVFLSRCYTYNTNTKEYLPLFKKVYLNEYSSVVVVMNPAFDDVGKWEDLVLTIIGVKK